MYNNNNNKNNYKNIIIINNPPVLLKIKKNIYIYQLNVHKINFL